jgi:Flp pilus assembly pilin Flp
MKKNKIQMIDQLKHSDLGQALTEYITLLVLVALVAVGAAQTMGKTVRKKIQTARDHINSDINFEDVR